MIEVSLRAVESSVSPMEASFQTWIIASSSLAAFLEAVPWTLF